MNAELTVITQASNCILLRSAMILTAKQQLPVSTKTMNEERQWSLYHCTMSPMDQSYIYRPLRKEDSQPMSHVLPSPTAKWWLIMRLLLKSFSGLAMRVIPFNINQTSWAVVPLKRSAEMASEGYFSVHVWRVEPTIKRPAARNHQ